MEFGFSLPGRGPLASIDVVLKLAEKADALRFDSLFVTDHVVMPVASGKSVYPYTTERPVSRRARAGLPRAAGDAGPPRARDQAGSARHQRARRSVSQPAAPGQDARDHRRALEGPRHPRRGRRLAPRGVRGARRAAVRGARARHRGVHQADAHRVDDRSGQLRAASTTRSATSTCCPSRCSAAASPCGSAATPARAVRRAGTIGDGWHPIAMRPPAMLGPDEYAARRSRSSTTGRAARGRDPKSITLTIRVPMDVRGRNAKPRDRRPAAVPGHRGRDRRRHPPLPGARRLALRLRPHRAGAARGPREHGALRERRAAEALARRRRPRRRVVVPGRRRLRRKGREAAPS